MFFYVSIFIVLALLAYFVKRNLAVFCFSVLGLAIIFGFRGLNIGYDNHIYFQYFQHFQSTSTGYMEPLWNLLNQFVIYLGGNYNVFLLLTAGILLGVIACVLWHELSNPQFGLFIYYALYVFCTSFNMMRQTLAISVVVLGFYFLNHKKNLLFFLTVFVASLIHQSALLAFLAFPFRYLNLNRWTIVGLLIATFLIGVTVFPHLDLAFLYGKYAGYAGAKYWERESIFQTVLLGFLMNIYVLCITFTANKETRYSLYFNIFLIGMLLMNLTLKIEIMSRILLYFTVIQILLIPIYLRDTKQTPLAKIFLYILLLFYVSAIFFKMLILGNSGIYSIYPYVMQIY